MINVNVSSHINEQPHLTLFNESNFIKRDAYNKYLMLALPIYS